MLEVDDLKNEIVGLKNFDRTTEDPDHEQDHCHDRLQHLSEKIEVLTVERLHAEEHAENLLAEQQQAEQQKIRQNEEIDNLIEDRNQCNELLSRMTSQANEQKYEWEVMRESLLRTIEGLEEENSQCIAKVDNLSSEIEDLMVSKKECDQLNESQNEHLASLEDENKKCNVELSQTTSEVNDQKNSKEIIDVLTREVSHLQSQLSVSQNECDQQMKSQDEQIENCKRKIDQCESEMNRMANGFEELIDEKSTTIASLNEENKQLTEQVYSLTSQIDKLKEKPDCKLCEAAKRAIQVRLNKANTDHKEEVKALKTSLQTRLKKEIHDLVLVATTLLNESFRVNKRIYTDHLNNLLTRVWGRIHIDKILMIFRRTAYVDQLIQQCEVVFKKLRDNPHSRDMGRFMINVKLIFDQLAEKDQLGDLYDILKQMPKAANLLITAPKFCLKNSNADSKFRAQKWQVVILNPKSKLYPYFGLKSIGGTNNNQFIAANAGLAPCGLLNYTMNDENNGKIWDIYPFDNNRVRVQSAFYPDKYLSICRAKGNIFSAVGVRKADNSVDKYFLWKVEEC